MAAECEASTRRWATSATGMPSRWSPSDLRASGAWRTARWRSPIWECGLAPRRGGRFGRYRGR